MRNAIHLATGALLLAGAVQLLVLVPDLARRWSAERRRFVLLHELVHVLHRDPVRHLVARLALAMDFQLLANRKLMKLGIGFVQRRRVRRRRRGRVVQ